MHTSRPNYVRNTHVSFVDGFRKAAIKHDSSVNIAKSKYQHAVWCKYTLNKNLNSIILFYATASLQINGRRTVTETLRTCFMDRDQWEKYCIVVEKY